MIYCEQAVVFRVFIFAVTLRFLCIFSPVISGSMVPMYTRVFPAHDNFPYR